MVNIYCVKCRERKEVDKPEEKTISWTNKSGVSCKRECYAAVCPTCGTKMKKFKSKGSETAKETE